MARLSIITAAKVNQPPIQLGTSDLSTLNRTNYTFTQNDFINTTPPYSDPDGDNPQTVRIDSLPAIGSLELNSVAVSISQQIPWSDIGSGLLVYIPENQDASYTNTFNFDIADEGSGTFSGLVGTINIQVLAYVNQPPTTGDNTINVNYGTSTVLTRANFTTETTPVYSDPEGDAASKLKITSLASNGVLRLNGIQVTLNQIIDFTDIDSGNLTFLANGNTAGYTADFDFEISDLGSGQFSS